MGLLQFSYRYKLQNEKCSQHTSHAGRREAGRAAASTTGVGQSVIGAATYGMWVRSMNTSFRSITQEGVDSTYTQPGTRNSVGLYDCD